MYLIFMKKINYKKFILNIYFYNIYIYIIFFTLYKIINGKE